MEFIYYKSGLVGGMRITLVSASWFGPRACLCLCFAPFLCMHSSCDRDVHYRGRLHCFVSLDRKKDWSTAVE